MNSPEIIFLDAVMQLEGTVGEIYSAIAFHMRLFSNRTIITIYRLPILSFFMLTLQRHNLGVYIMMFFLLSIIGKTKASD